MRRARGAGWCWSSAWGEFTAVSLPAKCAHPLLPPGKWSSWVRRGDRGQREAALQPGATASAWQQPSGEMGDHISRSPRHMSRCHGGCGWCGWTCPRAPAPSCPQGLVCCWGAHGAFNPLSCTASPLCPVWTEQMNLVMFDRANGLVML